MKVSHSFFGFWFLLWKKVFLLVNKDNKGTKSDNLKVLLVINRYLSMTKGERFHLQHG